MSPSATPSTSSAKKNVRSRSCCFSLLRAHFEALSYFAYLELAIKPYTPYTFTHRFTNGNDERMFSVGLFVDKLRNAKRKEHAAEYVDEGVGMQE